MKLLAMALLIAACGGTTSAPQAVPPSTPRDAAPAVGGPSDADCAALLVHAIELAAASHPATTDADRTQLRDELAPEFTPKCRAMTLAQARCARDAATTTAFAACDSAQAQ